MAYCRGANDVYNIARKVEYIKHTHVLAFIKVIQSK